MKILKKIFLISMACQLSGCWFIFIPGGVMGAASDAITGAEGNHCGPSTAKIGDKLKFPDGRVGTVQSVSGTTYRCKDPALPTRIRVEFD